MYVGYICHTPLCTRAEHEVVTFRFVHEEFSTQLHHFDQSEAD